MSAEYERGEKDHEKGAFGTDVDVRSSDDTFVPSYRWPWVNKFLTWGVEYRGTSTRRSRCLLQGAELWYEGIHPVPVEARTETHFSKIFFIWMSANVNILSYA